MEELHKQVRRAERRLRLQRFADVLGWFLFAAPLIALTLIVVDKFIPLGVQNWIWLAGAIALGFIAAIVWSMVTGGRMLDAALEIDRRFALKERVSSVLGMTPEDMRSPAGQTVSADALCRVRQIDVAERFSVVLPRKLFLSLAPALAAIFVILFVHPASVDKSAAARPDNSETIPQVKKVSESILKQMAQRRELAEKERMPETENLFSKLEAGAKELASTPQEREKALEKLNDLARQLQERREQLGGADKVAELLDQLKNVSRGPADKFAQDLGKNDLKQAVNEIDNLKNQLENGKLTDQQRTDLAKQFEQMKDKLSKMAERRQTAQDDLRRRRDQMRQTGQQSETEKLDQQIRRSEEQSPQMQPLLNIENKLGQCTKNLKDNNDKGAAKDLKEMQNDFGNLQRQMDEKQMLDGASEQLAQAKDQMVCQNCGGEGCEKCGGNSGPGIGNEPGALFGPETKADASFYDSQVKQNVGKGTGTVVDQVDGPNIKGNVQNQIQKDFDSTRRGSTDPLTSRQLPKKLSQQAREYFDGLREGD